MIEHTGMGPLIENLIYTPIAYEHQIGVMEREDVGMVVGQGVTQAHVRSWEEQVRNLRIKKCALDDENRAIDKIQCYSKMLTCLTKEGMASNGEPRGAYFAQEEQWNDPKLEKTGKKKGRGRGRRTE